MSESHLEEQLLDKQQDFLLELVHGFCFEARQKRILIGNTPWPVWTMGFLSPNTSLSC